MNICKKLLTVVFLVVSALGIKAQVTPCPPPPAGFDCDADYDLFPQINLSNVPTDPRTGDMFCIDLDVADFVAISSLQFSISFDPNVIQFVSSDFTTTDLPSDGSFGQNVNEISNGNYGIIWTAAGVGVCMEDGSTVMSICFEVVGDCGDFSPFIMTANVTEIDASVNFEISEPACALDTILFNQDELGIKVACDQLTIFGSSCPSNMNTGCITFSVGGGSPDYTVIYLGNQIDNFPEGQDTTICGLAAGAVSVSVQDSDGTIESLQIPVEFGDPLVFDLQVTPTACNYICNGAISIENINSTDYTVEWSNFVFNKDEIDGLCNGLYIVTVTDAGGCTVIDSARLETEPMSYVADLSVVPTCVGANDGVLSISPQGGTPFQPGDRYMINNQLIDVFVDNFVSSGDYPIEITDANGCVFRDTFDVNAAGELDFVFDTFEHACDNGFGQLKISTFNTNGAAAANPLFRLYDADTDALVFPGGIVSLNMFIYNDIPPASYYLTIREDGTGCMDTIDFEILESPAMMVQENFSGPGCDGSGAFAEVIVTGGTPDLSYEWDYNNEITNRIENMPPGDYMVTITDALNCEEISMFTIPNTESLVIQTMNSSINCDGSGAGGTLEVTILMGGTNLDIVWTDVNDDVVGNGAIVTGIPAGFYTVTVTDLDSGCEEMATATISNSGSLDVQVIPGPPTCPDGTDGTINLIVSGGSGMGYMMDWNHPNGIATNFILPGIPCGFYDGISVTDSDGCTVNLGTIEVPCPERIELEVNLTRDVSCFGEATGEAVAEIVGGTTQFNFLWSSGESNFGSFSLDTTLVEGENWVIANDGVCSSDTVFFTIGTVDQITISSDASSFVDASCFGIANGEASIEAEGGIAPNGNYTYTWLTDGTVGNTNSGLAAGIHYIEITDEAVPGCTVLDSIFIQEPDSMVVEIDSFTIENLSCSGENTAMFGVNVFGGNSGDLDYSWTNVVSDNAIATNLGIGTYCVTVTDTKGCSDSACYEVVAPEPLSFDVIPPEIPDCFGGSTCIAIENVTGGTGTSYQFAINPFGQQVGIDSCLEVIAGMYNVTLFDQAGCSVSSMIEVTQPAAIEVDLGPDIIVDLGDSTTLINVNIDAQEPIDTIIWDPFMFLECKTDNCSVVSVQPQQNVTYGVTVVDINGCEGFDDINVTLKTDRNVFVSNIFSPNGDGQNDEFKIQTGRGVQDIESFVIFDRWGNKVFDAGSRAAGPDGSEAWDGTHKGDAVQPGVYVYFAKLTFIDGFEFTYKGSVTLIR